MRNVIFYLFVLSILGVSCKKKEFIKVSGSTTVLPVVSNAADYFKENHKGVNIVVNAGGSGVGINQLGEGKTDMGMISRDITETEKNKYKNINFKEIIIGRDAVVPVVSSEIYNSGVKALTYEQIGKIYKGEVDNWKEFGGPDKKILCVDKEKARGTRHIFMKKILGDKEADAPGADLVLGSNNEEQTAIIQSDAAIGMLSNAWLNKDVKGLGIILNDGIIIEPTLENLKNGSFPIIRNLVIVVRNEAKGKLKAFIDYLLSNQGQKLVEKAGYVGVKN